MLTMNLCTSCLSGGDWAKQLFLVVIACIGNRMSVPSQIAVNNVAPKVILANNINRHGIDYNLDILRFKFGNLTVCRWKACF